VPTPYEETFFPEYKTPSIAEPSSFLAEPQFSRADVGLGGRGFYTEAREGGGPVVPTRTADSGQEGRFNVGPERFFAGGREVAPGTPGAISGDTLARRGVMNTADRFRAGVEAEMTPQRAAIRDASGNVIGYETSEQTSARIARSDESMRELDLERAAGIVPRQGMAAYEESVRRVRAQAAADSAAQAEPRRGQGAYGGARRGVIGGDERDTARTSYLEGVTRGRAATEAANIAAGPAYAKATATREAAQNKMFVEMQKLNPEIARMNAQAIQAMSTADKNRVDAQLALARNDNERQKIIFNSSIKAVDDHFGSVRDSLLRQSEGMIGNDVEREKIYKQIDALSQQHNKSREAMLKSLIPEGGKMTYGGRQFKKENGKLLVFNPTE
jgi:hypothetical protein